MAKSSGQSSSCSRSHVQEKSLDDYFMAHACLAAMQSQDPKTQVGAVIVNEHQEIVGTGYNSMPHGCPDDKFSLDNGKHPYVCHAECNAIFNRNCDNVKGCLIYVNLFPCSDCAMMIIKSEIKGVYYRSNKHHRLGDTKRSKERLDAAKIRYKQLKPVRKVRRIDLSKSLLEPKKIDAEDSN